MSLPLLALLLVTLPLGSLVAVLEAALRGLAGLRPVLLGNLIWAIVYYGSLPWLLDRVGLAGLGVAQLAAAALQSVWVLGVGRRRGWLSGAFRGIVRSLVWGGAPAIVAVVAALAWPGRDGLAPAGLGPVVGLALLAGGALWVSRGEGLFRADEKRWLLARLPGPLSGGRLAALLRAEGETS